MSLQVEVTAFLESALMVQESLSKLGNELQSERKL